MQERRISNGVGRIKEGVSHLVGDVLGLEAGADTVVSGWSTGDGPGCGDLGRRFNTSVAMSLLVLVLDSCDRAMRCGGGTVEAKELQSRLRRVIGGSFSANKVGMRMSSSLKLSD